MHLNCASSEGTDIIASEFFLKASNSRNPVHNMYITYSAFFTL